MAGTVPRPTQSVASSSCPFQTLGLPRAARIALATLALVASSMHVWFLYDTALPELRALWAPADPLQSLSAGLGYACIALVSARRPESIRPLPWTAACASLFVAGSTLWLAGMARGSAAMACVDVCVAHLVCSWAVVLTGVALCALGNRRDLVVSVVLGEGMGVLLRCVLPHPAFGVAVPLAGLPALVMLAASYPLAAPYLRRVFRGGSMAALSTTNPESFLSPTHRVFVLVAFFEFIHGIALAEKSADLSLAMNVGASVVVAIGAAFLLWRRDASHEDALLNAAALLMLAGFMLRPLSGVEGVVSGAFSFAGASFSWMLLWMALASIGMSNPLGSVWTLAVGYVMQALSLAAGAELGQLAIGADTVAEHLVNVVNALVMVGFVGYLLVGLRGFSFSRTFAEIVPIAALEVPKQQRDEELGLRCAEAARRFGLTERELDVINLMARGKTGPEIQDALSISRNTAKSHVRHIYRKVGVHSQQELIDLVGTIPAVPTPPAR